MKANSAASLRGLYAITDSRLSPGDRLLQHVEAALQGGAALIQYRDKTASTVRRLADATALRRLCRDHDALLIINDDVDLAKRIDADGVHLGGEDSSLASARKRLGKDAVIGISCYNRLELAQAAAARGADYIAFGRFFPSRTKPDAVQAHAALLTTAKAELELPLVAIGGITPENGAPLISAGADMLAVIHGVFGEADIQAACRRFTRLFEQEERPR
ncbi:MAG: thiamine phosphate synthase [Candidatus Thiodiazotropha sp. (ex Ctena orbiculata)]|nr:thiamine phosphate synthase [Candidatus Thiodiazotropha taylori]PUB84079.1 MAG: thiamine phosphate synthase [gamma proteobacterium symbiont of Ctena orbiculata]MBT2996387.1 thiamine phosphate synthase [Candidatus Thiodiazotropha taylori]MBT3000179.1 thiamine phosphate synthase [Candidatus Thiodiazotropha taylori]MBV2106756.1 thiamine phosphate synthase [Candidatus Thiodiazotropha taylori]